MKQSEFEHYLQLVFQSKDEIAIHINYLHNLLCAVSKGLCKIRHEHYKNGKIKSLIAIRLDN